MKNYLSLIAVVLLTGCNHADTSTPELITDTPTAIEQAADKEVEPKVTTKKEPVAAAEVTNTKTLEPDWKTVLSSEQYRITRRAGTEKPFTNEYDANEEAGIYYDVTGEQPLYHSAHKYDSGTGWPSFWRPINEDAIGKKTDFKLIYPRTEVHSSKYKHHLGHIFKDGPEPTGLRHCLNSASLTFVPYAELDAAGKALFDAVAAESE